MKNNQLFNASLLFFLFIVVSLAISGFTHRIKGFAESNRDLLENVLADNYIYNYYNLACAQDSTNNAVVFVDLRDPKDFELNHINNALNIPYSTLFDKVNLEKLKSLEKPLVLYAQAQDISALSMLMLKGMGLDDVKILPGSFKIIKENILDNNRPSFYYYNDEKALWDYAGMMGASPASSGNATPSLPSMIDIKPKVKGGC